MNRIPCVLLAALSSVIAMTATLPQSALKHRGTFVPRGGSLVLGLVSQAEDYMVIGADSRNSSSYADLQDDHACKVISLGNTVFFATGTSEIQAGRQTVWDPKAVARKVFGESSGHTNSSLAIAWGDAALGWFSKQNTSNVKSAAQTADGQIVTGGFVGVESGKFVVDERTLFYADTDPHLSVKPTLKSPSGGQMIFGGVAHDLIVEFFKGSAPRVESAWGTIGEDGSAGRNSASDVKIVRAAIQFAMDYSTSPDKDKIGGPIDVGIFRKNGTLEWVNRKPECSAEDAR